MSQNTTKKGLKWSFIDNILQQLINFIVGIILARILEPSEFGLLGIITVFIAISITLMDGGLNDAIINKQNTTDDDYNTVFWSNITFSVVIYLLLFIISPYIAEFFNQSSLTLLLRIGGLNILFLALSSIQRSLLIKEINFKVISLVSLVSVTISGLVAIVMAFKGFGVISLVVRIVLGQLITTVLFFIINSWRPSFVFDVDSFKSLYKYGINIFFSKLLNTIQNNIYSFVVGKIYSPTLLGYYTRADSFKTLASTNISNTIQRVSFPVLSNMTDRDKQIEMFDKFMSITFLITSLSMTILYINADSIVLILLGEKWFDVIPFLKILAISGLFIPAYNMNLNFLAVIRKTKTFLFIEILNKVLLIPTVAIGLFTSIIYFLWATVIYSIIIYFISFFAVKKYIGRDIHSQIYSLLKICVPILLCLIYSNYLSIYIVNYWASLIVGILVSCVFFFLCLYTGFKDIYGMIRSKI